MARSKAGWSEVPLRARPAAPLLAVWSRRWWPEAAVLAGFGYLVAGLVPDVEHKPLFEDEAVAGLIAARPFPEVIETVVDDRGGAPLHFVLAHLALALEPSATALRALSVVFAAGAVVLCYLLAARLAGRAAGAIAAAVAATSTALGVYGSFGRMYSLFALTSALALLLFVSAAEQPTRRRVFAAAAGAWLAAATHPYGAIAVGAEALVAVALWRGRPLRAALPVVPWLLAAVPLGWASLRLSSRFDVGVDGSSSLTGPGDAWSLLSRALASFAGGSGVIFGLCLAAGGLGLVLLLRRRPAFGLLAGMTLLATPLLLMALSTGRPGGIESLSPRHLMFALPVWAALTGVAVSALASKAPPAYGAAFAATVAALLVVAPAGGLLDPRGIPTNVTLGGGGEIAPGGREALEEPARVLRANVGAGDLLFPYSPVYLAALTDTRRAVSLPRAEVGLLLGTLRGAIPARDLYVAVPLASHALDLDELRARLGAGYAVRRFDRWLLLAARGPYAAPAEPLAAAYRMLRATVASLDAPAYRALGGYLEQTSAIVCLSLQRLDRHCPEPVRPV
jgi:hypothetical protein